MRHGMILATALALVACGQPEETPAAENAAADAADIAATPTTAEASAQTGTGTGVITAVDAAAGTVTVDHGPIPAVGWPAMTMRFDVSPAIVEAARTGDSVEFDVSVRDGVNEITAIRPG